MGMGKKGKNTGRLPELERAYRALRGKFPLVVKQKGVVHVGSDALLAQLQKPRRLGIRFWSGANPVFKDALMKALEEQKIKVELGTEYELESKGKQVSPSVIPDKAYADLPVDRMRRLSHVRACLICKEILDQCAGTDDEEYLGKAKALICAHIKAVPDPKGIACTYSGCIHHEDVPRAVADKMIELGNGDKPWRDVRKVLVSTIPLVVSEKDHPQGFDLKRQDIMHRHFANLPPSAGYVYVRLAPKRVTIHLWVSPAYVSRSETVEDVATLENVVATLQHTLPNIVPWCLAKYKDLKGLAEMDLSLEGGKSPEKET